MADTRALRFAGSFFPADPAALAREVDGALATAPPTAGSMPRAVISAHAGYRFSGRFTGQAMAAVPERPARVVVLSPSHRHAFRGLAFPSWAAFDTGLGRLPIDRSALLALGAQVHESDAAHDKEHGIETQLPFLARRWPGLPVVPLVIGEAEVAAVAQVIEALDAPGTLFVLSSDLSHFLNDAAARASDAETARIIEQGEARLTGVQACGARAVAGWLASRPGKGSKALRLGMGNSGDVTGDLARVVGYGAWAFYPIDAPSLAGPHRQTLLRTARRALDLRLSTGREPKIEEESFAHPLRGQGAAFVTLTKAGRLRGCLGSLQAHRPLCVDVAVNAQKAGLNDPRFAPLTAAELAGLRLKIAVLTRAVPFSFESEAEALAQIEPGRDGLILSSQGRRGTFLPMVWDEIPDPAAFLRALKRKAGLPESHWAADVQLLRYRAESFAEGQSDLGGIE